MSSLSAPEPVVTLQKLCPRCSTISQTDAEHCPHCGKGYRRRNLALIVLVTLAGLWIGWVVLSWVLVGLLSTG